VRGRTQTATKCNPPKVTIARIVEWSRHYCGFSRREAIETRKLDLEDLAPRIKELRLRQDELHEARVHTEAEMAARGVEQVDAALVKSYARDLRQLLEEADLIERKVFLRSFINRVEVHDGRVSVYYRLPMPPDGKDKERVGVLPIVTSGGAKWTIQRTFSLAFSLST
jgi:hypothetical protein